MSQEKATEAVELLQDDDVEKVRISDGHVIPMRTLEALNAQ